jgi:hypothetical protein
VQSSPVLRVEGALYAMLIFRGYADGLNDTETAIIAA